MARQVVLVAVVIDQFSRRVNGFALFMKMPTSIEVCEFLDRVAFPTTVGDDGAGGGRVPPRTLSFSEPEGGFEPKNFGQTSLRVV